MAPKRFIIWAKQQIQTLHAASISSYLIKTNRYGRKTLIQTLQGENKRHETRQNATAFGTKK